MFKEPRVNVIESDPGFAVEVLGRTGLLHTEGSRSIHIDSEVLAGPGIAVYKKSIRFWDSPYKNEIIDDTKRDAIIDNIKRAFDFTKTQISVY